MTPGEAAPSPVRRRPAPDSPAPAAAPGARTRRPPATPARAAVAAVVALSAATGPAAAQAPATDVWLMELGAAGPEAARNVTARPGYDNQPSFTPEGRAVLYTSVREDGQADTYRLDLATGRSERLTRTPESEYSPTVMPGGEAFSAVRVERDSTQRLWAFDRDGTRPRVLLEDVAPVGYHAWTGADTVAVYVLGEPPTLRLAGLGPGEARVVARDVGRSLQPVPGRRAVAFLQRRGTGPTEIRVLDAGSRAVTTVAPALEGSEDFAWTPDGRLLMAAGRTLHAFDPAGDGGWRPLADLADRVPGPITRIAVAPDGRTVAFVAAEEAAP